MKILGIDPGLQVCGYACIDTASAKVALIEAGVPDGTLVAHKHGWISGPDGIIKNISDVGIVYTPGGNYVLTIFAYHPVQAVWEPVSDMFADLSEAIYNYFNLPE
jgi:hypothetical protein